MKCMASTLKLLVYKLISAVCEDGRYYSKGVHYAKR
nr:MAG TPA: hypothetical protein [Caudoviricetes sp.]